MNKKVSKILATAFILSAMPIMTANAVSDVSYINEYGNTAIANNVEVISQSINNDTIVLESGTYLASGILVIGGRIDIEGDVTIILADNALLNARKGLEVGLGDSLTITAQSTGDNMGKLTARTYEENAAIGGEAMKNSGDIVINAGNVSATAKEGAGIGGGDGANATNITINGGIITTSSENGAGVGGGELGSAGKVVANGGYISASSTYGTAIGGGRNSNTHGELSATSKATIIAKSDYAGAIDDGDVLTGMVLDNGEVTVYGDVKLLTNFIVESNQTLMIDDDSSLTVGAGVNFNVWGDTENDGVVTVAAGGKMTNEGAFYNDGSFINNGEFDNNTLSSNYTYTFDDIGFENEGEFINNGEFSNNDGGKQYSFVNENEFVNNGVVINDHDIINEVSATIENNGEFTIKTNAKVDNSGVFQNKAGASYTKARVKNSSSGEIID